MLLVIRMLGVMLRVMLCMMLCRVLVMLMCMELVSMCHVGMVSGLVVIVGVCALWASL
jgi:hypothetical protein